MTKTAKTCKMMSLGRREVEVMGWGVLEHTIKWAKCQLRLRPSTTRKYPTRQN